MIDTLGMITPMTAHLFKVVMADSRKNLDHIPKSLWKWVNTDYGRFKLTIDTLNKTMEMEFSPAFHLQGHNVFGINNLERLITGVMELIYERFSIPFTDKDKAFYITKGVEVCRIDLTASFIVGSQKNVAETMGLAREHLLARGLHIVIHEGPYGVETIYVGKNSSYSTVKFYNKYLELLAKNKSSELPFYEELLKITEKLVRVEFTLRKDYLNHHQLNDSRQWTVRKVRELLEEKLHELGFAGQLLAELPDEAVDKLTDDKRRKYNMWLAGRYVPSDYSEATVKRDVDVFHPLGIDITRPRIGAENAILLSSRLSPEKLKRTYPAKFADLGAVFF